MAETATVETEPDPLTRKRSVLVTGCSSGIGRATARAFAEADWAVVATARSLADVDALADAGCRTRELDVTDGDGVARLIEETVEDYEAIDCVVNNAAYGMKGPLEDVPVPALHRQFDVNVYGPHRLVRAALPHMRAQGHGRIVNVSSIQGLVAIPGAGAYSASKHALEAMSDVLRAEVEEFGVEVVLVEPGPVDTAFEENTVLPTERTPAYDHLYELYEDGRHFGRVRPVVSTPEEVAAVVLEAATCSDPDPRYPVGPVAAYGQYARFLPSRLRDLGFRLVRRFA